MPVLDEESGKSLECRQMCNHPIRKEVWKKSYTNELGRMCQGVDKDKNGPKKQQVAGYNTFFVIKREKLQWNRERKPLSEKLSVKYTHKNQTPIAQESRSP